MFFSKYCFCIGIIDAIFGIRDTYKSNNNTRGFITTNAYYKDYETFNSDKDNTIYKLKYVHEVKYNPDNPCESILVGLNNKKGFIYVGAFFVLGTIPFILFGLMMFRFI